MFGKVSKILVRTVVLVHAGIDQHTIQLIVIEQIFSVVIARDPFKWVLNAV